VGRAHPAGGEDPAHPPADAVDGVHDVLDAVEHGVDREELDAEVAQATRGPGAVLVLHLGGEDLVPDDHQGGGGGGHGDCS
jgi:hypothetical protein